MNKQILTFCVLVLSAVLLLASCGGKLGAHTHSFGEWEISRSAGCDTAGERVRFCSCGEKQTDSLPTTGHSYTGGVCDDCKEPENGTGGSNNPGDNGCAHANTRVLEAVLPNCTQKGLTAGLVCTDCEKEITKQTVIDALGHTEVIDPAVAPTCEKRGYTEGKHCTVCDKVLVRQSKVGLTDHSYGEDGGPCEVCGAPVSSVGLVYGFYDAETCFVSSMGTCTDDYVVIPRYSPDGREVVAIGDRAFEGKYITNVSIPPSVEKIGIYAFSGCKSLVSVDTSNVKTIGERAFNNCTALEKLYIDSDQIPEYAFYYCTSLTEVEMGDNVKIICENAFSNCSALVNFESGKNVEEIRTGAFSYCEALAGIILEDSLLHIGNSAFWHCENVTTLKIPDSVLTIGNKAFCYCKRLTEVVIGHSVTEIGEEAFLSTSLTKLTVGKSLKTVKANAFSYCDYLEVLDIADIAAWCAVEFGNAASNPLSQECILYLNGELITELVIPKEVTSITYRAFYKCYDILSVTFEEDSLCESIGRGAFQGLPIESIVIPDSVKVIGGEAFSDCTKLANVELSDTLETIGDSAFYKCSKITELDLPATLKSIGNDAFYGYAVDKVNITDLAAWCVISRGSSRATPLYYRAEYYPHDEEFGKLYLNGELLTEVVIPKEVAFISDYAFDHLKQITSLSFEEGSVCESIGCGAFQLCRITSVEMSPSVKLIKGAAFNVDPNYYSVLHITDLAAWCSVEIVPGTDGYIHFDMDAIYMDGEAIVDLVIPKEATQISSYTFDGFKHIKSIRFEEGSMCESIGSKAFSVGICDIVIPESVKFIGTDAFKSINGTTVVALENTNGWFVSKDINATYGTNIDSAELASDATTLLTSTYQFYYWRRAEE